MNEKALIISVCKVLCKASKHDPNYCYHCEHGTCKKEMYETFIPESIAVIEHLKNSGIIKKSKLI
jgi:hypothetical protein